MLGPRDLKQAIATLEAYRQTLGDDVVDVSLDALRLKLEELHNQPFVERFDQVTVLTAELTDAKADSELNGDAGLPEAHHKIWPELEQIVTGWGGVIEARADNGLVALFGVPYPSSDDCERAILAALDMRLELSLGTQGTASSGASASARPRIRIGINRGPGLGNNATTKHSPEAFAQTLSIANQLRQLAPDNGILISDNVYAHAYDRFDAEASLPIAVDGKSAPMDVYAICGEKAQAYLTKRSNGVEGRRRLVGRQAELDRLQQALQATADEGAAHFFVVEGEAGVGKSRLLYELHQLIALLPIRVNRFGGHPEPGREDLPYGLIGNVFLNALGIHMRSKPSLSWARLGQGLAAHLNQAKTNKVDDKRLLAAAHEIAQLLGLNFLLDLEPDSPAPDVYATRDGAWDTLISYFKAAARNVPVTVITLENIHQADERSLDFIDDLYRECRDLPVLFICSAQPSLREKRPFWLEPTSVHQPGYEHLKLPSLTSIESRHLVIEFFHGAPSLSLIELIVEQAGGNPSKMEALSSALIDAGVIFKKADEWRVREQPRTRRRMRETLTGLYQSRLQQLPVLEQKTLQRGAVLGQLFSKAAVEHLVRSSNRLEEQSHVEITLRALENKGLIALHRSQILGNGQEYIFKDSHLHRVVYESISPTERQGYHAQAAAWLQNEDASRVAICAGTIARHYRHANEPQKAAEWYGRAAEFALVTNAPETAIGLYRQALGLLSLEVANAPYRIRIYEALGKTLRRRARYHEALEAFSAMATSAKSSGEPLSEARAYLEASLTQQLQLEYPAALENSRAAEQIAKREGSSRILAGALSMRAWSMSCLDEAESALELAKEGLAISTENGDRHEIARNYAAIGTICLGQLWYDQALHATNKAGALFHELGDRLWQGTIAADLAQIALARRDYQAATEHIQDGLGHARGIGDQYNMMRCLRILGAIAQRMYETEQAAARFQEAYALAVENDNLGYQAILANDLGQLHLNIATETFHSLTDLEKDSHSEQAQTWLTSAFELGQEARSAVVIIGAHTGLGRLSLIKGHPEKALPMAREALTTARHILNRRTGRDMYEAVGAAWRFLGQIATELPTNGDQIVVGERKYDAAACFNKSLHAFARIGRGADAQAALTLHAWALLEYYEGDKARGATMWRQALDLFSRLGMSREVAWMNQFDMK